ncbi:MAG: DNA mismatch repair protein MutL, partial [Caulobacter sp.]
LPGMNEVSARVEHGFGMAGPGLAEAVSAVFDAPPPPPPMADGRVTDPVDFPLGAARAQVHETYVVAQTRDGIVIVDQHAAHERLVYERMKHEMEAGGVTRQTLLLPEVVELDPAEAERVIARADELAALGLVIEPFGPGAVLVRETPALLGE